MGDIADDYIQRMIERGPRLTMRERNTTACKLCGSIDVHWRETSDGWRLYENERQHPGNRYVEHDCTPQPTADGFEDEPT